MWILDIIHTTSGHWGRVQLYVTRRSLNLKPYYRTDLTTWISSKSLLVSRSGRARTSCRYGCKCDASESVDCRTWSQPWSLRGLSQDGVGPSQPACGRGVRCGRRHAALHILYTCTAARSYCVY